MPSIVETIASNICSSLELEFLLRVAEWWPDNLCVVHRWFHCLARTQLTVRCKSFYCRSSANGDSLFFSSIHWITTFGREKGLLFDLAKKEKVMCCVYRRPRIAADSVSTCVVVVLFFIFTIIFNLISPYSWENCRRAICFSCVYTYRFIACV